MIFYLTKAGNEFGIACYVSSWGPFPGGRMKTLFYEDLPRRDHLPPGTYIFSDLERLSDMEREVAVQASEQLFRAKDRVRLLNPPAHVPDREGLLRLLHGKGENDYRVARADEALGDLRYPVLIKLRRDHTPPLPSLLRDRRELERALRYLFLRGHRRRDLLVVEFCDTSSSDGVFRKYSAFVVGETILPRHLLFSRNWLVKKPDLTVPALAREQERYLEENPHREWLERIFRLSRIDYGRIDYSMLGDRPQVWEINTNPTVLKVTPRLTAAFDAIDSGSGSGEMIPMAYDSSLVAACESEVRRMRRRDAVRRGVNDLVSLPLLSPLVRGWRRYFPIGWYGPRGADGDQLPNSGIALPGRKREPDTT